MDLAGFVVAFAAGIKRADSAHPVALNKRSGAPYLAGIGPHTEAETLSLALASERLTFEREVPYPASPRSRCDVLIRAQPGWAIEIKMLRLMGDNGKPNDNMLMHVLSPYVMHRSAVTDCSKLLDSRFAERKAVVIFGYDYDDLPMDPAIQAFEVLAAQSARLSAVKPATFDNLVHPVHRSGRVFGWEVTPR